MLLAGPAAAASEAAQVRFVHAVPGIGAAQLEASEGGITERIATGVRFGQVGSYVDVPAGDVTLEVSHADGRDIAAVEERLERNAHYTVVALGDGERTVLVIRDGRARAAQARLRVVHAAAELGDVDVRIDGRTLEDDLAYQKASDYETLDPGTYDLEVHRPDNGALAASRGLVLTAGTSSTAFVVGSAGEPVSVVVATDRTAAPPGAPETGLGGLAGGRGLLAALLAGLLAGGLGIGVYLAVTGRARGHGA